MTKRELIEALEASSADDSSEVFFVSKENTYDAVHQNSIVSSYNGLLFQTNFNEA